MPLSVYIEMILKIIDIKKDTFHEISFLSSGSKGIVRECILPFYKVHVEGLPKEIKAIVATSDIQGREDGEKNRLLGEVVAEELFRLQKKGNIPKIDLAIIGGDLYDYPDCRKLGGTGDVTDVWNTFALIFGKVVGVLGNHDIVDHGKLDSNVKILDASSIVSNGIRIGGVSGIIGRIDRNQRKEKAQYLKALKDVSKDRNDIVVLHQGPDSPESGQIGEPLIREWLERNNIGIVIFGHRFWSNPFVAIGNNQVLNVGCRVFVFID